MIGLVIAAFVGPCLLCAGATWAVRGWALRRGFTDKPGGHKKHQSPVALGGGIAIVVAVCVPLLAGTAAAWILAPAAGSTADRAVAHAPGYLPQVIATHLEGIASKLTTITGIVFGAVILHIVGLFDDRRALGPWPKFIAQFAVALLVAGPLGIRAVEALPMPWPVVLTVLWIVAITNAFNFLDNMDGLSAGVGAIAAAILAVASMWAGQVFVPVMALVLSGALWGFLLFNFHPARIFMGDAGSLVIGYMLAVLTVLTTYYDPAQGLTPLGVMVPVVLLAVPLYDVISVVIHRIRLGVSPLKGDRRHFSHRLVAKGMSTRGAVLTIYLATATTGLSAVVLPRVDWPSAVLLLVQCLCVVVMIAILEHMPGKG